MEHKVSKAQLEVWDWKEKAYEKMKLFSKKERVQAVINSTKDAINKIRKEKDMLHS
jgi:predicted nuclease with TOPRIM domain